MDESPEARGRDESRGEFHTFDGVRMDFDDDSFDLVYCNQVLEHVRRPLELLGEIRRVLRPGGWFVGSTSHLEPYHSLSLQNFTPYGFSVLVEDAGLSLEEIRPGIDSLTLILRVLMNRPKFFSRWWEKESPLNRWISFRLRRKGRRRTNARKLLFCGQFCFCVRKKGADS